MNDKEDLLEMKNITVESHGLVISENVSLSLKKGEVLALLVENGTGKSSLMKSLIGMNRIKKGHILLKGKKVEIHSPSDADSLNIGMIQQESMLFPALSVAENILLGRKDLPLFPSLKEVEKDILEWSERYGLRVDPRSEIGDLSKGEKLRIELLKLLYRGTEILILDEPAKGLAPEEREELHRLIKPLAAEGKSLIYITGRSEEAISCSHRIQILAKGKTRAVLETDKTSLAELKRQITDGVDPSPIEKDLYRPGDRVLKLERLYSNGERIRSRLKNINLTVRKGEIFGIAGAEGNGQHELAECLMGLHPVERGTIHLKGLNMTAKRPIEFIQMGVGYIPSERLKLGSVAAMTANSNLIMKAYRRAPISRKGILQKGPLLDCVKRQKKRFNITIPSAKTKMQCLHSGDILRTVLAREIDACDGLFIAEYPTENLDRDTAEMVRRQLVKLRDRGDAVLLISGDPDELIQLSDRLGVLQDGKMTGLLENDRINRKALAELQNSRPQQREENTTERLEGRNRSILEQQPKGATRAVSEANDQPRTHGRAMSEANDQPPPQEKKKNSSGLLGRAMKEIREVPSEVPEDQP